MLGNDHPGPISMQSLLHPLITFRLQQLAARFHQRNYHCKRCRVVLLRLNSSRAFASLLHQFPSRNDGAPEHKKRNTTRWSHQEQ